MRISSENDRVSDQNAPLTEIIRAPVLCSCAQIAAESGRRDARRLFAARHNVLIHAKEIIGIVFFLDRDQLVRQGAEKDPLI